LILNLKKLKIILLELQMFNFIKSKIEDAKIHYGIGVQQATKNFSGQFNKLFVDSTFFNNDFFDDFEEILIESDVMPNLAITLREKLEHKILDQRVNADDFMAAISEVLKDDIFRGIDHSLILKAEQKNIFLIVGVNGVGKTTTIAKLAYYFSNQKVILAAGDTFRAGAIEQLSI